MSSVFAMKCPKCGSIVRQSANLSMFNMYHDNFCAKCGLSVHEFSNYIKMNRTMKSEFRGTL